MIAVKNQGKGALSVDLITRTQLLNDTLPAISDNLRMDIRYANLNGTPISVNDIIQELTLWLSPPYPILAELPITPIWH